MTAMTIPISTSTTIAICIAIQNFGSSTYSIMAWRRAMATA